MSWDLYLYLPAEGVDSGQIAFITPSSEIYDTTTDIEPKGASTPCYSATGITDGHQVLVIAALKSGYTANRWVLNEDGVVSYPDFITGSGIASGTVGLFYTHSGASKVWLRLEAEAVTTYSATIAFDANGGTGGPSTTTITAAGTSSLEYTLPTTVPTKSGYTFSCWQLSGYSTTFSPGQTVYLTGTTSGITYTLVAVWEEVTGSGSVRICVNGESKSAVPYVYYGGAWLPATADIYNGGWKKGV